MFTYLITLYAVSTEYEDTPASRPSSSQSFLIVPHKYVSLKDPVIHEDFKAMRIEDKPWIWSIGGGGTEGLEGKPAPVPLVCNEYKMDRSQFETELLWFAICRLRPTVRTAVRPNVQKLCDVCIKRRVQLSTFLGDETKYYEVYI